MATKSNTAASTGAEITGDGSGVALPPLVEASVGPVALAEPEGGWPADEFTGKGGNYVRDPFTGVRTPAVPAAE